MLTKNQIKNLIVKLSNKQKYETMPYKKKRIQGVIDTLLYVLGEKKLEYKNVVRAIVEE